MKNKRITIYDIAREMNIAASTVTRALNGKKGVGEETRLRIIEKANEMGYRTNLIAKSLQRGKMRIGVVVNNRMAGFHSMVVEGAKAAAKALADFNVEGEYALLPCENLHENIVSELKRLVRAGVNGVIFVPGDAAEYDEIIREVSDADIALGTVLVSCEHPQVAFSVYPDSRRAGYLAADILRISGLAAGDEVLIALGSMALPSHRQSVEGFRAGGDFRVDVLEHGDNADPAFRLARDYISSHPGLKGVYCATAVTAPVCRAAQEAGRGDLKIVGTEITGETARYLESGALLATLFQDPVQQGRRAFRAMYDWLEGGKSGEISDIRINPVVVTRGNLDLYENFEDTEGGY